MLITGLHWAILLILCNRWTVKPVLLLVCVLTVAAGYFSSQYHIYLNKDMIRNIFETDFKEASELFSIWMLFLIPPIAGLTWLLFSLKIRRISWKRAILWRLGAFMAALAMVGLSLWPVMKELLPILRAHKELRYLVNPSNYIISTYRVVFDDFSSPRSNEPLKVLDAQPARTEHATTRRPIAVIMVVGETVRAQNWGLNGYERQTTPMLAERAVINFSDCSSSGTDTATSLPAMFSVYGRHDYDRNKIIGTESLLHLINRAGVDVLWRDNQSGDKAVARGLPSENLDNIGNPSLKNGNRYYDEILLDGLESKIDAANGDTFIVLHTLGNHGPAYFERYPDDFRRWTPTCDSTDLAQASDESVVNAYDNSILYADYVLSKAIDLLSEVRSHDTALIYVSDHGESLGERGMYLHGLPYMIAPAEQTKVPMFMWFSKDFVASQEIDLTCLREKTNQPVSHDFLFHTILNLLDIKSSVYNPDWDLLRNCRER